MGTSTMSGHYVCHLKKEGRWVGLGELHKDEKMFSWTHALVQNRACIHGRQNTHAVTMYTFPTKAMKIVTGCSCDEPVLIPLRSMLKCTIGSPVLAGSNLCSLWVISSVSGFVYLSSPQFPFIPHQQTHPTMGDTDIYCGADLGCDFDVLPLFGFENPWFFLHLSCNYMFLCTSFFLFRSWLSH